MAQFKAPSIPAEDFHRKYPRPVLFTSQPREFKVLDDPADLREWEQMLANEVGLKSASRVRLADEIHASGGTCCESGNPSNDCDED
jgi:hypothetical protein